MTLYLDLDAALTVAAVAVGGRPEVADYGLLESARARPRASVMGSDAYPTLFDKAGALLHSLTKNHCLVDGNKRLAWLGTVVFCHINGRWIEAPDDEAYDFVIAIADGTVSEVGEMADRLASWSRVIGDG